MHPPALPAPRATVRSGGGGVPLDDPGDVGDERNCGATAARGRTAVHRLSPDPPIGVRIGVGRPDSTDPEIVAGHVLGRWRQPREEVTALVARAADAAERNVAGALSV